MSDRYTYPSEKLKQLAIKQLNEDPVQVNAHIESFRRWVKSMPHLSCPTDAKFLLMFLRVAKFDHAKAQKRLDNFCTIRSSERGHPEYFDFPKLSDPIIDIVYQLNFQVLAGLTDDSELLIIGNLDKWNPKELPLKEMIKPLYMGVEMILMKEEAQVCGMKMFNDMSKCGKAVLEAFSDTKVIKNLTRVWQDCYPVRIKGQIIYNEPGWYAVILNIFQFFLHEKHKKRIYRIKNDLPKAFERIPGLQKLLPKDMGGSNEALDVLRDKYVKEIREFYKNGSPFADIKVDESKRPAETMKFLTQYADYTGSVDTGTDGTFTKFDAL